MSSIYIDQNNNVMIDDINHHFECAILQDYDFYDDKEEQVINNIKISETSRSVREFQEILEV